MRVSGVAAVPTDTIPKQTTISGQPHMLAYINPQEAQLLKDRGGIGSLFGIPTFFNPEDDMGLESSLADQQAVSAGLGATASGGDEGIGTVTFSVSPQGNISVMGGPNTNMGLTMTDPNFNPNLGGENVTVKELGRPGADRGPLGPSTGGFSITPKQVGKGMASLLSIVPNPMQPLAQVISKGLAIKDIGDVLGGSREGPLGSIVGAIENFSLKDLTSDLAAKARGEK